jgi:rhodanese-related sulfurtransferase
MNQAITVEQLQAALASPQPPLVLDVRRAAIFEQAPAMVQAALWRDPALVNAWAGSLDRTRAVVVYCVHGHQVSQGCASALASMGFDARFLEGGFEAWSEAGGQVQPKQAVS